MRNTGGSTIAQGFLTPEALFMVGKEVRPSWRLRPSSRSPTRSRARPCSDALATVGAAEEIEAAAAAEALQALIVAGYIRFAAKLPSPRWSTPG
ncbi:MAG: hypothetical protein R3A10_01320 [Caldilineaceae bacterium]